MTTETQVTLLGSLTISGTITAKTGLFIGGTDTGISIGGADKTVVRNALTNQPYIPGSSLRGKMRSLLEKAHGLELNSQLKGGRDRASTILIHACMDSKNTKSQSYTTCPVCQLFGISSSEKYVSYPSRLIVRDANLTPESVEELKANPYTDMPFTEIKTEVAIDRLTSAANPRNFERVPAGAAFAFEIVFNFYFPEDFKYLEDVFLALSLVENDALGGQSSRGYGQVAFGEVNLNWKPIHDQSFQAPAPLQGIERESVAALYEKLKGA